MSKLMDRYEAFKAETLPARRAAVALPEGSPILMVFCDESYVEDENGDPVVKEWLVAKAERRPDSLGQGVAWQLEDGHGDELGDEEYGDFVFFVEDEENIGWTADNGGPPPAFVAVDTPEVRALVARYNEEMAAA